MVAQKRQKETFTLNLGLSTSKYMTKGIWETTKANWGTLKI